MIIKQSDVTFLKIGGKMLSHTISMDIHGIEAHIVEIEVDIIKGLPNFTIKKRVNLCSNCWAGMKPI